MKSELKLFYSKNIKKTMFSERLCSRDSEKNVIEKFYFQQSCNTRVSNFTKSDTPSQLFLLVLLGRILRKYSETPKQRTCLEQRIKCLVPNVTIFVKLQGGPYRGHLLITDKFLRPQVSAIQRFHCRKINISFCIYPYSLNF